MVSAREMLKAQAASQTLEHVEFPVTFDDVSLLSSGANGGYIHSLLVKIHEREKVVPQYRNIKEKLGGMLFGFYINRSVDQQNMLNTNLNRVFDELESNRKEIESLRARIVALHEAEKSRGEDR